ncbi:hypothetical protein N7523_003363 [Penicillium sp. IBT 18751x]|nr:hypothetical protein N7523_003363 [Penicillium sp. IBT 18751x]
MLLERCLNHNLFLVASLLFNCITLSYAEIVDNGKLVVLNGINYYAGGIAVSALLPLPAFNLTSTDGDLIPLTVIRSDKDKFTYVDMEEVISNFTQSDDVFQHGFMEAIFLSYDGEGRGHLEIPSLENTVMVASSSYHPQKHVVGANLNSHIPQGPYFISASTGSIYEAFRLYPDHQLAFTEAAISDGNGGFKPLPAVTEGAMTKSVAVPSRLYYTPTLDKPLAGLRLGVKDIFHLKGLRTSGGNRAFHDLYAPRNATGSALQRLIDMGAVIVGKMGTVQFANGDNPTADWVDFHCPFNPRGDGYQAPGGSSSGPGAGMGSYDWLDIAVGSDTGGSMRSPGGMQGLYANRPSTGAVDLDEVLPLCDAMDTAGVFARNAETWHTVIHAWYQNFTDYQRYPKRIYYADSSFPNVSTDAGALLENFVVKLEKFLGTKREHVDIATHWENTHPSDAPSDISDLLNTTYATLVSVYQYDHLALPFYADYAKKHDGRRPFINPGPLARWTWGQDNEGDAGYQVALTNKTIFKDWWETDGFGVAHKETCSEGIYLYPYTTGETQYRNFYFGAPTAPPMGFSDGRIGPLAAVPDFVVPVGEVPYNSTISLKTEYMPVTVSFVASRGCDFMLVNLIRELEMAGILKPVKTGTRMYPQ